MLCIRCLNICRQSFSFPETGRQYAVRMFKFKFYAMFQRCEYSACSVGDENSTELYKMGRNEHSRKFIYTVKPLK